VGIVFGHGVERDRPGFDPGPQVIDVVHSTGPEGVGVRCRTDEGGSGVGNPGQPGRPIDAGAFLVFDLVAADARAAIFEQVFRVV
jgi:hypothetical protein